MYRDARDTVQSKAAALFAALGDAWSQAESRFHHDRRRSAVFLALESDRFRDAHTLRGLVLAHHESLVMARGDDSVEAWSAYVASLERALAAIDALAQAYVAWSVTCATPARDVPPFPPPTGVSPADERASSARIAGHRATLASVLTGADEVVEHDAGPTWLRMTLRRRDVPFALTVDASGDAQRGVVGIATTVPLVVPWFSVRERSFGDELASMFRFRAAPDAETGDEAFDGIFRVRLTKPFDDVAGGHVGVAVRAALGEEARHALVQLAHFEVPHLEIGHGRAELWLGERTCFEGERGNGRRALREIVHTAMDALAAIRAAESEPA